MIHRAEHKTDFARISWSVARDERLSLECRGFLVFLLCLPDKWDFNINGLATMLGVSRSTVMRLVKELKSARYITQKRRHNKKGQFYSYEWHIYEIPEVTENRTSVCTDLGDTPNSVFTELGEDRSVAEPKCGFPLPIKNEIIEKNEISKKNEIKEKRTSFDSLLEPLPEDLRETFKEFLKMRKAIKAPMTEKALDLAIKKSFKLGGGDPARQKAVVEQSIMNSWKGLFPLKDESRPKTGPIQDENPFTRLRREEGYI